MIELNIISVDVNKIRIAGISSESIVDGPGIRYTVFFQGCYHACKGCHNRETHCASGGYEYYIQDMIEEMKLNPMLKGITLSGGDPFFQLPNLLELILQVRTKLPFLDIWCYTGYLWEELLDLSKEFKEIEFVLRHIDCLVDGRYEENLRSLDLEFRGSSNQRIIKLPESLKQIEPILWDRR